MAALTAETTATIATVSAARSPFSFWTSVGCIIQAENRVPVRILAADDLYVYTRLPARGPFSGLRIATMMSVGYCSMWIATSASSFLRRQAC